MFFSIHKHFIPFFLLFILNACSNSNTVETIDAESILPQAQRTYNYETDTLESQARTLTLTQEILLNSFPEILFDENNILKEEKMFFILNRLGYTEKEEFYFTKDSIPFHFITWTFEDSLKTTNAFYNWLDCFNHDCRSLKINEEKNASKEAFIIWVTNHRIIYLSSNQYIPFREWQSVLFLKNERKNKNEEKWNYIIQQAPRGKLNWVLSATKEKK